MRTFAFLGCLCLLLAARPAPAQVDAPVPASRDPAAHVLLGPAQDAQFAPLRAADDERIAAIIAADPARLDAILSDDLHYAHSNGVTDNKAAFIESLTSRRAIYKSFEYTRHRFIPAGPGVVLMTGRALVRVDGAGGNRLLDLNFLAVWREEGGRWRFLAWQSNRHPPATPPAAAK
jgi:hypothetical protein